MSQQVEIVPYRDGPYLVRGPVNLKDQNGESIDVSRRTIALCRCGKSRIRPLCDGTHRLIGFRASSELEQPLETNPRRRRAAVLDDRARESVLPRADLETTPPTPLTHLPADPGPRTDGPTARSELRGVQSSLERLMAGRTSMKRRTALKAAAPLVASAYAILEDLAERERVAPIGERAAGGIVSCLFLVRGALAALASEPEGPDERLGQVITQLRAVARYLDPGTQGQ